MSAPAAITTLPTQPSVDLARTVGWLDSRAVDAFGRRLGRVAAVLADDQGRPWWLMVRRHGHTLLAPVESVTEEAHRGLLIDCTREELEASPGVDREDVSPALHDALLRHFGLAATAGGRLPGGGQPRRRRFRRAGQQPA